MLEARALNAEAFEPGDCRSIELSASLYARCLFPTAIGHSSTWYSIPRTMHQAAISRSVNRTSGLTFFGKPSRAGSTGN